MKTVVFKPPYKVSKQDAKASTLPKNIQDQSFTYDTVQASPSNIRTPIVYSALTSVVGTSSSGTVTTGIATVSEDCIAKWINLCGALRGTSISGFLSFRLDIDRGGINIFTTRIMFSSSGTGTSDNTHGNPELALKKGDNINMVAIKPTLSNIDYDVFVAVVTQPYL